MDQLSQLNHTTADLQALSSNFANVILPKDHYVNYSVQRGYFDSILHVLKDFSYPVTGSTSAFKVITDKFKEGQSLHAYLLEPETDWTQATTTPVWLKEISFQKIGETLVLTA